MELRCIVLRNSPGGPKGGPGGPKGRVPRHHWVNCQFGLQVVHLRVNFSRVVQVPQYHAVKPKNGNLTLRWSILDGLPPTYRYHRQSRTLTRPYIKKVLK